MDLTQKNIGKSLGFGCVQAVTAAFLSVTTLREASKRGAAS